MKCYNIVSGVILICSVCLKDVSNMMLSGGTSVVEAHILCVYKDSTSWLYVF